MLSSGVYPQRRSLSFYFNSVNCRLSDSNYKIDLCLHKAGNPRLSSASCSAQDSRLKIHDIFIRPVDVVNTYYYTALPFVLLIIGPGPGTTKSKTGIGRCRSSHPIYFQTGIGVLVWYMDNNYYIILWIRVQIVNSVHTLYNVESWFVSIYYTIMHT